MNISENKNENIKILDKSIEGNNNMKSYKAKEKIDVNSIKSPKKENLEYKSNIKCINLKKNNNIKNKVIKNPIIILNINKSNPTNIYKKMKIQVNDQLNPIKSDKNYNKYYSKYIPYNDLDFKNNDNYPKSEAIYNFSQTKNKIKTYYPEKKEIKKSMDFNNNSAIRYNSPISQYIYSTRIKDNRNYINKIYGDSARYYYPRKFGFLDKNENTLANGSIFNKKKDFMKIYNYNIIKGNQNKTLYDVKNITKHDNSTFYYDIPKKMRNIIK